MTLPTHLAVEVEAFNRGDLSEDYDRFMNLLSDLVVAGEVPWVLEEHVRKAIDDGHLSPSGDRQRYASDPGVDHHWSLHDFDGHG